MLAVTTISRNEAVTRRAQVRFRRVPTDICGYKFRTYRYTPIALSDMIKITIGKHVDISEKRSGRRIRDGPLVISRSAGAVFLRASSVKSVNLIANVAIAVRFATEVPLLQDIPFHKLQSGVD